MVFSPTLISRLQIQYAGLPAALLAACAALVGCSGSSPGPTVLGPGPAHAVPVLYALVPNPIAGGVASEVVSFNSSATGAAFPLSTLALPADLITLAMTTDTAGQIYVAGTEGNPAVAEILVYAAGSTGAATPTRTILTGTPPTDLASSIAVDSAGQIYVFVSVVGTVQVFAANATGVSTPLRTLQVDQSLLLGGEEIAVDGTGSLYVLGYERGIVGGVTNPAEVLVYASGASGAAAPVRTLLGLNNGVNAASIAVDAAGNLFAIVSNPANPWLNATEVAEFAPGSTGNAAPVRTIVGNFGTFGVGPTHLAIDAADNVYVFGQYQNFNLPQTPLPVPPLIATFPASASGTSLPANQFTSTAISDGAFAFAVH